VTQRQPQGMKLMDERRIRRSFVSATLAAAAIVMAGVGVAFATESTIFPGVGIGKVKLGMTAAQVKKTLGRDYVVNSSRRVNGKRYVEYGWDFSRWTTTFVQEGRTLRVVQIGTSLWAQKTVKRIGPGSTWRALVRGYPTGICATNNQPGHGALAEYLVQQPSGTQTIYFVPEPTQAGGPWRVLWVHVRTRWEVLPEFAPVGRADCRSDWRTADAPI
jgi:hypothetical protein